MAQMTPVGVWRSIDDKSGEAKAEIRIADSRRRPAAASILKSLKKDAKPDDVCEECGDDRKGKPIAGLEIIRGGKPRPRARTSGRAASILDPENGKEYRASFTPIDGGKKLEVRGYLGAVLAHPDLEPRRSSAAPQPQEQTPCPDSKSRRSPCSAPA